ncbi:sterol desaturase family protein [Aliiroseovarius sp. F47248L]|uniref:sterol desaturase family protein n=1 Tax=Aliiroseovarius sp. F47248L TaxID=2926420 RepID=UPI001FF55D18|nr:sterol desaturase family protein [Aliiroseovarius sp. F47248L]MCK0139971.1 sterol desaturase family protein [Aliiroseovarius sp. F47248L]
MKATLAILINMGTLQRLFPFWLIGVFAFFYWFTPWFLLALVYGAILQFFVEYVMHRFLYHREPPTEQSVFNDLYRSHIGHHEFPNDAEYFTGGDHWYALRFAMVSLALHSLVLWPFLGFGTAVLISYVALFVGSVSAFTFYEYCHTLAHVNVPKGWFGQRVTRSHLAHHYQDHQATFHVSFGMGWIDRLFGTKHDRDVARKRFDRDTILSMGMDPEDLRLVTARKAFGITKLPRGKLTRNQATESPKPST